MAAALAAGDHAGAMALFQVAAQAIWGLESIPTGASEDDVVCISLPTTPPAAAGGGEDDCIIVEQGPAPRATPATRQRGEDMLGPPYPLTDAPGEHSTFRPQHVYVRAVSAAVEAFEKLRKYEDACMFTSCVYIF
jgi:hypothetical protein